MVELRRNTSIGGLTVVLALIPPLVLAVLIGRYAVDVPYFDQWTFSALTAYFRTGGRDLSELFAQHHEARMFFPSLVNLACEYLSQGDLRASSYASLLLAALSLFNIQKLTTLTLPRSPAARMVITVIASALIFSPVQWENWLWSNQIGLFFPIACLTTAIWITYTSIRFAFKLMICAGLAFVATFSFANGLLCWVILPLLLVWQPNTTSGRVRAAAAWAAMAAGSIWLFFRGFHAATGHATFAESLAQPKILALSLLGFLGAPLSSGGEIWLYRSGRLAGLALLLMLLAACIAILAERNRPLLTRAGGWLAICAFVLSTAAITALGRSTMSSVFLHDSRYTTFSIYLIIGLSGLLAVLRWRATLVPALVAVVIVLHLSAASQSLQAMEEWRTARLQSKACLALINVVASPCAITKVAPSRNRTLQVAGTLNDLALLHPPLLKTAQLPASLIEAAPLDSVRGNFTSLKRLPDGSWIAAGHATLPGREEPADGVVLTYADANGAQQILALADTPTRGPRGTSSGWVKWFILPDGGTLVRAYAYDALAGKFHRLTPDPTIAGAETAPLRFGTESSGTLDRLSRGFSNEPDSAEPLMAFGWSYLRAQARVPDAILITCGEDQRMVGSGETHMPRPDVVRALGNDPRARLTGFGALIDEQRIPAGGCLLKAWAYDSATHTAQPIDGPKASPSRHQAFHPVTLQHLAVLRVQTRIGHHHVDVR